MNFEDLFEMNPYSLKKNEKETFFTKRIMELTELHRNKCDEYANILSILSKKNELVNNYKKIPFLPVRLFKEYELKSVSNDDIVKKMTSSGTTGQKPSMIYLDRTTSSNQQKAMVKIVSNFLGTSRMPMIIIDKPSVLKNRESFSARGAGILGFSMFGTKRIYALNDDMELDVERLEQFLEENKNERIFLFGFTYIVWLYFYKELLKLQSRGISFDLSNAVLIHGGGWKKLSCEAVSASLFHDSLYDICGLDDIHDYYGMVEQTGCIYMQCKYGHFHASNFSDVIIRNPNDFSECSVGERGIIQVVSTIPESYPGHSLLTEDEGTILGEDDCPCGRLGKYFEIHGRIENAEIRGCSDTFEIPNIKEVEEKVIVSNLQILDKLDYLLGSEKTILNLSQISPLVPFSDDIISFLDAVSRRIRESNEAKKYPDVVALGFWLRKSSTIRLAEKYNNDELFHLGCGVTFHIPPSNVPVNFAYSLFTSFMCGNANVVRMPSKDFKQIKIIVSALYDVLQDYKCFEDYFTLIKYSKNKEITDYFSAKCDVRMIWGGDNTILDIRNSLLSPRAYDITFADRYSLTIIDSDEYMKQISAENGDCFDLRIDSEFYNDAFISNQNACTSPCVIVWIGSDNNTMLAKRDFWDRVSKRVEKNYTLPVIRTVDKFTTLCSAAMGYRIKKVTSSNNKIYRVEVTDLKPKLMDYRGNSGYFYEYNCKDICELYDLCNDKRCQTIGLYGNRKILTPLLKMGIKGVDRIVPIGHTMDFDIIWDGYNLFERLTRTIVV